MSEAIIIRGSSNNGSGGIPVGCIVMWSGAVNNIPSGWALCNGNNGTPDLRNRFIVGAGSTYAVGATGGSDTVILTENQMPKHRHSYTKASGSVPKGTYGSGLFNSTTAGYTDYSGSGEAHENRPPYYALCFIMYIG